MGVQVDEPGQQGDVAQVHHPRARGRRAADRHDPIALHGHYRRTHHAPPGDVEHARRADHGDVLGGEKGRDCKERRQDAASEKCHAGVTYMLPSRLASAPPGGLLLRVAHRTDPAADPADESAPRSTPRSSNRAARAASPPASGWRCAGACRRGGSSSPSRCWDCSASASGSATPHRSRPSPPAPRAEAELHRRAAAGQRQSGHRERIPQRRDDRGADRCAGPGAGPAGGRGVVRLHAQGPRGSARRRPPAQRRHRAGRERAPGQRPPPHHRPPGQRERGVRPLVGDLRAPARRHLRRPERDRAVGRVRDASPAAPRPPRRRRHPRPASTPTRAYLRARYAGGRPGGADPSRAAALFQEAIAGDSSFAPAWAGLADAQVQRAMEGGARPVDAMPAARAAAVRALALDTTLAAAHATLGVVRLRLRLGLGPRRLRLRGGAGPQPQPPRGPPRVRPHARGPRPDQRGAAPRAPGGGAHPARPGDDRRPGLAVSRGRPLRRRAREPRPRARAGLDAERHPVPARPPGRGPGRLRARRVALPGRARSRAGRRRGARGAGPDPRAGRPPRRRARRARPARFALDRPLRLALSARHHRRGAGRQPARLRMAGGGGGRPRVAAGLPRAWTRGSSACAAIADSRASAAASAFHSRGVATTIRSP